MFQALFVTLGLVAAILVATSSGGTSALAGRREQVTLMVSEAMRQAEQSAVAAKATASASLANRIEYDAMADASALSAGSFLPWRGLDTQLSPYGDLARLAPGADARLASERGTSLKHYQVGYAWCDELESRPWWPSGKCSPGEIVAAVRVVGGKDVPGWDAAAAAAALSRHGFRGVSAVSLHPTWRGTTPDALISVVR